MNIFNIFKRKTLRERLEKRFLVYTKGGEIWLGDFDGWDSPDNIGIYDNIEDAEIERQEIIEKEIIRRQPMKIISK